MVLRHDLVSALEAGLEAPAPATAAYFALAWKMKFQVAEKRSFLWWKSELADCDGACWHGDYSGDDGSEECMKE